MLTTTLLLAALTQTPAASCHQSGSSRACGYDCRAEFGEVRCAQTPAGFCTRIEGQLLCWDPPLEVQLHPIAFGKASCRSKYKDIACGYVCASSENHLACAQTPFGVCTTRFDEVICWDPSPELIHHHLVNLASPGDLRGASCVTTETAFDCGWDCKKSYQGVQCAKTPAGTCSMLDGRISCFDPPLPPIFHPLAAPALRGG